MTIALALGLLGALALAGVYKALELRWPDAYESLNDTFALDIVQSWWRLVAFRVVPVFVVGLGVSVTTMRLGGWLPLSIAVMIGIHAAATNGRVIGRSFWRDNGREFRVNHASYHIAALTLLVLTGVLIGFVTVPLSGLVPGPEVLLEGLWTALLVAIAAGALVSLVGKPTRKGFETDEDYYIWRATRDVGLENVDHAFSAALAHGGDPVLLRAVMFAEALQRPRWVRNLERVAGTLLGGGTFGVTQVSARRPISDQEAITQTASALASRWGIVRTQYAWTVDDGAIWGAVGTYNGEPAFIGAVQRLYRRIFYRMGGDGHVDEGVMFRTLELRRYEDRFAIRFITDAISVAFVVTRSDGKTEVLHHAGVDGALRCGETSIPTTSTYVEMTVWGANGASALASLSVPSARISEPDFRYR